MHFFLFGSQYGGGEWGRDTSWVWGGEGRGVRGSKTYLCPSWRCCRRSQSLLLYHWYGQHGSWLHDTAPCNPHSLPALPLGACSGHKNIRRLKSVFFLTTITKVIFILRQVNATCALYWPAIGGTIIDSRCPPPLLLQCIVCNSKLVYVVWTLMSMQKSL